jgi:steroid delta-isomerase-like uncharacterized protein
MFGEKVGLDLTPGLYEQVRDAWLQHSRNVGARNLDAVVTTLADDCVYEIVPIEQRWEGHDGARAFYQEMFDAFPDAKVKVENFVVGPQGVFQYGVMKATSKGWWGGLPPTGRLIELKLIVFFPWNAEVGKFAGERVWFV